jgi:RNA polymerase sigma-70 factor (ECF subfamily)
MPAMPPATETATPIELERRLVEQAKTGDRVAARRFIRRFQRPVAAILRRMLRPSGLDHLTDDLAQETFVRAFAALPRFEVDGPAKVSTWLLTIATRLALQQLQRRRVPTETLADRHETIAAPEAADADVRRAALGRAIERAVGELPAPHRAAFLLREYHHLDYTEIAETLEVDLGTVKSRLSRARVALRAALAEERHD